MSEPDSFSKRQSHLSPSKRALLEQWALGEVTDKPEAQAIPRFSTHEPAPLSFAQQRLWFLDQLTPGSSAYNIHQAVRLVGPLHIVVLEKSLNEITRRHAALRTTFMVVEDQPVQLISPTSDTLLPVVHLEKLPADQQTAVVQQLATREAQNPFDLARGPLMRVVLLRLNEEDHVLLLTMHHIISDGWSMGVFLRELTILYRAFSSSEAAPLPELPVQYTDFVRWQRQLLQGKALEKQLAYWKQQLAGAPALLTLPTDRPRPAIQTYRGAVQNFTLPRSLSERLKDISRKEGVTLFMLLLASFQTLLSRYTQQDDIVVSTPVANRMRPEIEGLIGLFANTLALRTDLSGDPPFRELLNRVRATALSAYAYQDLPFEQLVRALDLERDLSHNPLFQVMFVLQNTSVQMPVLPGLTFTPLKVESATTKLDLWLVMAEGPNGLGGSLEYSTDLFDAPTITRMLKHFRILLEGVTADPGRRLSNLPLLTGAEQRQLLVGWNDSWADYPLDLCLHHLFETQVERTPDAVAVIFEGMQWTYQELNRRANQLARYLQTLGVGPEVVVGICMERSLELVVGLLGILKAGGAYMPLDPTYPPRRLDFMLRDAQAPIVLLQQPWEELSNLKVVRLDLDEEFIACQGTENLSGNVGPDNMAYIIYTSGSTGLPKGVINTHRGICNRLHWMQEAYHLLPTDRVLQKTSFSFDVSVWEFFWPLLTGALLVVARPEAQRDSAYLVEFIAQQQITTLHFVPPMLQVFLEEPELERYSSLKHVICSGETLSFELQERFFARLHSDLYNLYGPTEAAIDVTSWTCQRSSERRLVPIGRPIANIELYIFDRHLQPVPIGTPGELHIGGIGLARGYLHRPELTATRFIPHPYSTVPGARLYKTGDRVRYLPDGNIEFLGRLDNQVKLRGFRVELGEIETALTEHPDVRESVVLICEDTPGYQRLVAYIVPCARAAQSTVNEAPPLQTKPTDELVAQLRAYLRDRLPAHMIPAPLILLEALPLLSNGKVDRRALSASLSATIEAPTDLVAPRTAVEETLTAIWAEVLALKQISVFDNFFELGGDSIRSILVVTKARKVGLHFTTKQMFQYQTIAELAQIADTASVLRTRQDLEVNSSLIGETDRQKIEQFMRANPNIENVYPLGPLQQRMLSRFLSHPEPGLYSIQQVDAMQTNLNVPLFKQAWQHVVDRHPILRTSFLWENLAEPLQVVHREATFVFDQRDWRGLSLEEQKEHLERYLQEVRGYGLQLTNPSYLRVLIAQTADDVFQFASSNRYITLDGWSFTLLGYEALMFYAALCEGQNQPRLEPAPAYRDYIAWLKQQDLTPAQEFWQRELKSFTAPTPLVERAPENVPGEQQEPGFTRQYIRLSQAATAGLQTVARRHHLTVNTLIQGAWTLLLSRYSGETDIIFGTSVSGRSMDLPGIETTIGVLMNVLPARMQVSPAVPLLPWLQSLQDHQAKMRQYEYTPLQKIYEWCNVPQDQLLFESYLVFQNLSGLALTLDMSNLASLQTIKLVNTSRLFIAQQEYPLRIDVFPGEQMDVAMSYYTRHFSASAIILMLEHLRTLLESIIANPAQRIQELLDLIERE